MRIAVAVAISCFMIVNLAVAERAAAAIKRDTHIPPQSLSSALDTFARDRSLQLVYATEEVGTLKTLGANGNLSASDTLDQLLEGTGLSYQFLDDKTVTVAPITAFPHAVKQGTVGRREVVMGKATVLSEGTGGGALDRFRLARAETNSSDSSKYSDASSAISDPNRLEEIVVSAQKRDEKAQNVGISITAFSAADLKAAGVKNLTDLVTLTPGLGLSGGAAGQNVSISIRGVTQQSFDEIAEGPNAVYVDEGYIGINNISAIGLFDLNHVEVLKGPQGTLFGRNATGGLINILTKPPSDVFGGYIDYTYGSYNTNRVEAALTGPLTEQINGRISMLYDSNDRYIENIASTGGDLGGSSSWALRAKLDARLSTNFDILFIGFATRSLLSWGPYFGLSDAPVYAGSGQNARQVDSVLNGCCSVAGPTFSDPKHLRLAAGDAQSSGNHIDMKGGAVHMKYDTAGWNLTSISDYKQFNSHLNLDETAAPVKLFDTDDNVDFDSFSQELRAFRNFGTLRFTNGLYYVHLYTRMDPNRQILYQPSVFDFEGTGRLRTNAYAAFGQAEWDFAPKWTLVGGLRYTLDQKKFDYALKLCPDFACPATTLEAFSGLKRSDRMVTGKAQIEYRPAEGTLIFAGYNRGAKGGSFNFTFPPSPGSIPLNQIPYAPEYLDSIDVGFKSGWWNGRAQFNGDVFYYNYHNYQAFALLPPLTTIVQNLPARTHGAELSILARPVDGLTTSVSVDYIHNRVSNVNIAAVDGSPVLYTKEAPFTSPWQATAIVRYDWPMFGGVMALQGDAKYVDTYFLSLTNFTATRQDGYTLIDANLSWTNRDEKLTISLSGSNLTDVRYKTVGFDTAAFLKFEQVAYGKPLWIDANIAYHF